MSNSTDDFEVALPPMPVVTREHREAAAKAHYGAIWAHLSVIQWRDTGTQNGGISDELVRIAQAIAIAAAEARRPSSPAHCSHAETIRGLDIPRRYGSYRSAICTSCLSFRAQTHHGDPVGPWQPKSEYAKAIADDEET